MRVALADIRTDGGTQPRAKIDYEVVAEYVLEMERGTIFPPVTVFFDGEAYWLADGFHRRHAHKYLQLVEIECDVRQGTRRDAVLFSVGANTAHGLRRKREDKRRAILVLLDDPKWAKWSDSEIAKRCFVDNETVTRLRRVTCENASDDGQRTYTTKHGTVATMNTTNIGGTPRAQPDTPIFDQTPMGAAADPRQTERARQIERDHANAGLATAIWEIQERHAGLPSPAEFVRLFPSGLRYTVTADDLRGWGRWFIAAADKWDATATGGHDVAAE